MRKQPLIASKENSSKTSAEAGQIVPRIDCLQVCVTWWGAEAKKSYLPIWKVMQPTYAEGESSSPSK
jgi:hypothetical protein